MSVAALPSFVPQNVGFAERTAAGLFTPLFQALNYVSVIDHNRAVELCCEAKTNKRRIYFIGNGGSAAIASHMAGDWVKNGGVAAMCFNDAALTTCIANDIGYEQVFAKPLALHGHPKDVLFAISSSGRSKSITNAAEVAISLGLRVITLSAFKPDNALRNLGDVNFYVPSDKYGVVEVAHHAICHSILDAVIDDAR